MARDKKTASAETTMLRADLAALRTDIEALRTDIEQRFNRGAAVIAKVAAESGLDTGLRTDIEALRTDIEALHVHIEALHADTERRFTHLESKLESEIADSDDCGRGFRLNAAMRSDRKRPPVPIEGGRGSLPA